MNRWRLRADKWIVWAYYLLIQAAVTLIRAIRGRHRDGEGTP